MSEQGLQPTLDRLGSRAATAIWLTLSLTAACGEAPGAEDPAAEPGPVEMVRLEVGPGGTTIAERRRLEAEEYQALVNEKLALMKQASRDGVEQRQQSFLVAAIPTTSHLPPSPCNSLDAWLYDRPDGWVADGGPRTISCWRNTTQSVTGCTNFQGDSLTQGEGGNLWDETKTLTVWAGVCRVHLNGWIPSGGGVIFRDLDVNPFARVSTTPPWHTIWLLDTP
jgi:hypothetical protein